MPTNLERVQKAFEGSYAVERELGSGGMATVYLAHDLKHDREVALKVLRPELSAALGSDRFSREIRIAARLAHPHILPLHDSGEMAGVLFYVMPYAEGESLRARVDRDGPLPIMETVRILREIVDALTYAHGHGVVHRDIKPDNVMLTGRHALVMDFGVAKAVSEAGSHDRMTTAGIAIGTPAYMAPEQASADPNIDHRADIYAFGVLAYELLIGKPPFGGGSAAMVLSAHMTQRPKPVLEQRPGVPQALSELVMKCLEKEPANRWQSAEQMMPILEALGTPSGGMTPTATAAIRATRQARPRWFIPVVAGAGVILALGLGTVALLVKRQGSTELASTHVQRLAVLPLQNLSGDPTQDGLVDGLHDALITELTQRTGLTVISRTSVMRYRRTEKSLVDIARELNADAILEGSVQRSGSHTVINANLVQAANERSLWAQSYERDTKDPLQMQGEVVRAMAQDIMTKLGITVGVAATVANP